MGKKMLIDAAHPEETRVAVVQDNRVEEFDFESSTKTRVRGNIYLAKVTRIEPSLQAAFVDYGGNRHGFLAFNEIHPDYYQIPAADREALLAAEAELEEQSRALAEDTVEDVEDIESEDVEAEEVVAADSETEDSDSDTTTAEETETAEDTSSEDPDEDSGDDSSDESADETASSDDAAAEAEDKAEGENGLSEAHDTRADIQRLRRQKLRQYKIQEVIKRRQVLLVQVVKEERGNKGAALTSYMSLAGRYCVLMPNTGRGGGISRKITNVSDRKRLKGIVEGLDVPEGMGLIIRTAGAKRTKTEIKRDYEYLLRLWENVRSLTLESTAPSLVYEEGSLVKRAIRDLYSKDVDEVMVEGADAYKEAKAFMKMLTPSHAKNVKQYKDAYALFQRYQVEHQLDQIYNPQVQLKSGGYLVINPTEALVSIDVNSGRATKERTIESTALKTNLEAAEEVARQCRLRDLAGLLVIDFIDMEENRNNRAVEKRLKESMKNDRARVQIGRISSFGLLEMSRQRMRSSVLEGSSTPCPACEGTGHIRSTESTSLRILRAIEEQSIDPKCTAVTVRVSPDTAIYLLNNKRVQLHDLETRYEVSVNVETIHDFVGPQFELLRKGASRQDATAKSETVINVETPFADPNADNDDDERDERKSGEGRRRRRRRRRRGGDKSEQASEDAKTEETEDSNDAVSESDAADSEDDKPRRRRRRGRRGGRRRREENATEEQTETTAMDASEAETESSESEEKDGDNESEKKPRRRRRSRRKKAENDNDATSDETSDEKTDDNDNVVPLKAEDTSDGEAAGEDDKPTKKTKTKKPAAKEAKPKKTKSKKKDADEEASADNKADRTKPAAAKVPDTPTPEVKVTEVTGSDGDEKKPTRRGWWNRRSS